MLGLVLTAGGARGAYQTGVLRRIAELPGLAGRPAPFAIVAGASAGAINGAALAARGADFADAATTLADTWCELSSDQVFHSDPWSLARTGAGLARDFALGGLLGHTVTHGLLDTAPLAKLLKGILPRRGVARAIGRGDLYALAVTATSYHSGRSFIFVQGREGHPVWSRSRRLVLPTTITHEHVLASSAIPIVFPPVRVACDAGNLWFGDGGMRLVNPMSPAIRLGASHLLAVGIRSGQAADALAREEIGSRKRRSSWPRLPAPPLAQVCGAFMNAIFLDHLDADHDHLVRMNELVRASQGMGETPMEAPAEPMRVVEPLVISPSEDFAMVAKRFAHRMPRLLRYVMEGLGTPDAQAADLMSYLLFDADYTTTLVEIGHADADARIDEIEAFLADAGAFETVRSMAPPLRAPGAESATTH